MYFRTIILTKGEEYPKTMMDKHWQSNENNLNSPAFFANNLAAIETQWVHKIQSEIRLHAYICGN